MADTTWKASERAIAARLGGKRTGPSGRAGADVLAPGLAVEVKCRKAFPVWLTGAMTQALKAGGKDRLPVVVLHLAGRHHENDVVLLRLGDLEVLTAEKFGGQIGGKTVMRSMLGAKRGRKRDSRLRRPRVSPFQGMNDGDSTHAPVPTMRRNLRRRTAASAAFWRRPLAQGRRVPTPVPELRAQGLYPGLQGCA